MVIYGLYNGLYLVYIYGLYMVIYYGNITLENDVTTTRRNKTFRVYLHKKIKHFMYTNLFITVY